MSVENTYSTHVANWNSLQGLEVRYKKLDSGLKEAYLYSYKTSTLTKILLYIRDFFTRIIVAICPCIRQFHEPYKTAEFLKTNIKCVVTPKQPLNLFQKFLGYDPVPWNLVRADIIAQFKSAAKPYAENKNPSPELCIIIASQVIQKLILDAHDLIKKYPQYQGEIIDFFKLAIAEPKSTLVKMMEQDGLYDVTDVSVKTAIQKLHLFFSDSLASPDVIQKQLLGICSDNFWYLERIDILAQLKATAATYTKNKNNSPEFYITTASQVMPELAIVAYKLIKQYPHYKEKITNFFKFFVAQIKDELHKNIQHTSLIDLKPDAAVTIVIQQLHQFFLHSLISPDAAMKHFLVISSDKFRMPSLNQEQISLIGRLPDLFSTFANQIIDDFYLTHPRNDQVQDSSDSFDASTNFPFEMKQCVKQLLFTIGCRILPAEKNGPTRNDDFVPNDGKGKEEENANDIVLRTTTLYYLQLAEQGSITLEEATLQIGLATSLKSAPYHQGNKDGSQNTTLRSSQFIPLDINSEEVAVQAAINASLQDAQPAKINTLTSSNKGNKPMAVLSAKSMADMTDEEYARRLQDGLSNNPKTQFPDSMDTVPSPSASDSED